MWEQIVTGIVTGIGYGIAGWQKNAKQLNQDRHFNWLELGKSAAICGIVGGIAGYTNQDFNLMLTGVVGIGITKGANLLYELIVK